jgi:general secretion pathway protein A
MNKKLLSLYSLKFNPFSPEVPTSALWSAPSIESFCWRIEQQIGEGGFALAIGDPGTGKSAALRILVERLGNLRDVVVGVLSRPQASLADFYRELGQPFFGPFGSSQPMGQRQCSAGKVAPSHRELSVSSGALDR